MNAPAFWTSRSPRDRAILAALAAVVAAGLVLAFAWLPLERGRDRLAAALPDLRASVAEMRAQAGQVQALRAAPVRAQAAGGATLSTLVSSGELARDLAGARLAMADARRVRLTADDASWTRLAEWIARAQAAHGLVVEEATVEALPAAGRVRASLVLAAP